MLLELYEIWTLCAIFGGATNHYFAVCLLFLFSERISNNSLSTGGIFYFDSWLVLNIPYDIIGGCYLSLGIY
jgi:hypothetical protein